MKYHRLVSMLFLMVIGANNLFAADVETELVLHQQALDMIWMLLAASLVFFMQAGFAMVEVG